MIKFSFSHELLQTSIYESLINVARSHWSVTILKSLGKSNGVVNLLQNRFFCCTTCGTFSFHANLIIPNFGHVSFKARIDILQLLKCQCVKSNIFVFSQSNACPTAPQEFCQSENILPLNQKFALFLLPDVVGFTERYPLSDQVVCQVCGQHFGTESLHEIFGLWFHSGNHTGSNCEAVLDSIHSTE
jgi:hypothetical protein